MGLYYITTRILKYISLFPRQAFSPLPPNRSVAVVFIGQLRALHADARPQVGWWVASGKPAENHRKTMGKWGNSWEKHRKMGKLKLRGKPWKKIGKSIGKP